MATKALLVTLQNLLHQTNPAHPHHDALTNALVTLTNMEERNTALERLEGMNVAQSYLEGYDRGKADQAAATGAAMQTTVKRILTVMTEDPANSKAQEAIENLLTEQNEQLIRAWAWGNESPSDDPNPYAVEPAATE